MGISLSLSRQEIPEQARLLDVGIRGVHPAHELLDGYDALILVDAVTRGEAPGSVSIFERSSGTGRAHPHRRVRPAQLGEQIGMAAYRIEPEHSEVFIEARSNVHPIEIRTQGLSGTIDVDVRAGRLSLSAATRATLEISADLLRSGIDLYDKEIHRMIEVRKYRSITGQLLEASEIASGRYRLKGSLSLHGVTRDIDGEVTVRVRDDDTLEIEGTNTLDMRDFNLDPPKILMLEVQPEISIRARIRAVRAA